MRTISLRALLLAPLLVAGAGTADAQLGSLPLGSSGSGSLGLPNISAVGAGNAAGVLGYCLKRNYLSGDEAGSVLGTLTGKPEITSSQGYAAGAAGNVISGDRPAYPLRSAPDQLKSRVCELVLNRAKSFL